MEREGLAVELAMFSGANASTARSMCNSSLCAVYSLTNGTTEEKNDSTQRFTKHFSVGCGDVSFVSLLFKSTRWSFRPLAAQMDNGFMNVSPFGRCPAHTLKDT